MEFNLLTDNFGPVTLGKRAHSATPWHLAPSNPSESTTESKGKPCEGLGRCDDYWH